MVLQRLNQKSRSGAGDGLGAFAIVASTYNARFVNGMLAAAEGQLRRAGAAPIVIARVPGAFEIPLIASILAKEHRPLLRAIICLGVILKGENFLDVLPQTLMLLLLALVFFGFSVQRFQKRLG